MAKSRLCNLVSHVTWMQELVLQALLSWAESAAPEQAEAVQQVLQQCLGLASWPCRQVRMAFAEQAPALAQPRLLKALYGVHPTSGGSSVASLEAKLLQVGPQLALLLLPSLHPLSLPVFTPETLP